VCSSDLQGYASSGNLGDMAGAIKSYQSAVKIYENLLLHQPNNIQLQKNLALGFGRIASIRDATNQSQQALDAYRQALSIWERLDAVLPEDLEVLQKMFGIYVEINSILLSTGDLKAANELFQKEQAIAERRIKLDSSPSYFLWYSYRARGQFLLSQGNPAQAYENFGKALEIITNLSKKKSNDVNYNRFIAITYINLGDTLGNPRIHNLGDWEASLYNYQQSQLIFSRLAKADHANIEARHDLSSVQARLGDVLLKMGRIEQSLSSYRASLEMRKGLANIDRTNIKSRVELGFAYQDMGDILLLKKDLQGAINNYEQALAMNQGLSNTNLADTETSRRLLNTLSNLGRSYKQLALNAKVYPEKRLGYWYRAKEYFHQALELLTNLQKQGKFASEFIPWPSQIRQEITQSDNAIQALKKSALKGGLP